MISRLKPHVLPAMLADPEAFAGLLRLAIGHYAHCMQGGDPARRYDGLGPWAPFFHQADLPVHWLELLWASTEGDQLAQRMRLVDVLHRVVGALPGLTSVKSDDELLTLRSTVQALCQFVRRQRGSELIVALRARAYGPGAWMDDDHLRPALLLAAYACVSSVEACGFLHHLAGSPPLLRKLDYAQLSVLCAHYITSARARLMSLDGRLPDAELEGRVQALCDSALRESEHPRQVVEAPLSLAPAVCAVIEEAIENIELPDDLRFAIDELLYALNNPQQHEDTKEKTRLLLAKIRRLDGARMANPGSAPAQPERPARSSNA